MTIRDIVRQWLTVRDRQGREQPDPALFGDDGDRPDLELLVDAAERAAQEAIRRHTTEPRMGVYSYPHGSGFFRVEGLAQCYDNDPPGWPFVVTRRLFGQGEMHVIPLRTFLDMIEKKTVVYVAPF